MATPEATSPTKGTAGTPIFFKLGERVQKVTFNGSTMDDVHQSFAEVFPLVSVFNKDSINFTLIEKDTKKIVDVVSVGQFYPNCVLTYTKTTPTQDAITFTQEGHGERRRRQHSFIDKSKLVVAMVGLPVRGVTFVARRIARYLNWIGVPAKVFDVGTYRRKMLGAKQEATFFDPSNAESMQAREKVSMLCFEDLVAYLDKGGHVGIFDATNGTQTKRRMLVERCKAEGFDIMFVEILANDKDKLESNMDEFIKSSPDYQNIDPILAKQDLQKRISYFTSVYEEINDDSLSYVKIFDMGTKVATNQIHRYLPSKIVFLIMNIHTETRPIWLCRHGQSEFNIDERIGGDPQLTALGEKFAQSLATWVIEHVPSGTNLQVWTSTLQRTIQTAQYIPWPKVNLRQLVEIDAGDCDGMTYDEIAETMPNEYAARAANKLTYRYPKGESYEDVIQRLESVVYELERQRQPVLVIAHQAVLRCLYAYFMDKDQDDCPYLPIPLHTAIELIPKAYGWEERMFKIL